MSQLKSPLFKAHISLKIKIGCQLMIIHFSVVQDKHLVFHGTFVLLFSFLNVLNFFN